MKKLFDIIQEALRATMEKAMFFSLFNIMMRLYLITSRLSISILAVYPRFSEKEMHCISLVVIEKLLLLMIRCCSQNQRMCLSIFRKEMPFISLDITWRL